MYNLMKKKEVCLTTNSGNRDFSKNIRGKKKNGTESDKTPTPPLITENESERVTFVSKILKEIKYY